MKSAQLVLGTLTERQASRFWSRVDRNGADGCWLWTGSVSTSGYGSYTVRLSSGQRITRRAHRLSYLLTIGPFPEDLHLDHLCRVRNCVNPDHLEPVTAGENARRSVPYRTESYVRRRGVPLHARRTRATSPRRAARITEGDGDPRHGTMNGYTNLWCSCDPCTAAHTAYHYEWRHRKRLMSHARATIRTQIDGRGAASTASPAYDKPAKEARR